MNMPWQIDLHAHHPIVETRYSGFMTPAELSAAVQETIQAAKNNERSLFLGDCTELEGGHSLFDLYGLVDMILASGLAHKVKEAIVLPTLPDAAERVEFWETACLNRGIKVKIFANRQDAIGWLLKDGSKK
jgi:hypothetical protein